MLTFRVDKVMLVLTTASLLCLLFFDFVSLQPNRILPGTGFSLFDAVGNSYAAILIGLLLGMLLLSVTSSPKRRYWQLGITLLILCLLPFLLTIFASIHIPETQTQARTGLGASFWCLVFLLALMLVELKEKLKISTIPNCFIISLVLIIWFLLYSAGALNSLALVREYTARATPFHQAVMAHFYLVGGALLCSTLLGIFLVFLMRQYKAAENAIFPLLNFIQTIPSLALFGLLIAPLGYLSSKSEWLQSINVGGIGWAPALIALIAYSLLPMVRNSFVALNEVSAAVTEAARGMGMGPIQVFFQVRLPLAMPVILEGMRITTIQTIGLTAVAALIGAGGLGNFIFQGLGQAAMDMVLLGALPILVMALMADLFFSIIRSFFHHNDRITEH